MMDIDSLMAVMITLRFELLPSGTLYTLLGTRLVSERKVVSFTCCLSILKNHSLPA